MKFDENKIQSRMLGKKRGCVICVEVLTLLVFGLLVLCGGSVALQASEKEQPNVLVVMLDATSPEHVKLDLNDFSEDHENCGQCRFALGRAANVAGFLYGKHPMLLGVVSDYDWRRKPVMAESVAERFRKKGYRTAFLGEWGLGNVSIYRPEMRGFDVSQTSAIGVRCDQRLDGAYGNALTDHFSDILGKFEFFLRDRVKFIFQTSSPIFLMLRQGRYLTEANIVKVLGEVKSLSKNRPTLLIVMRPKLGSDGAYFDSGDLEIAQLGKVPRYAKIIQEMKKCHNVWQVSGAFDVLFGKAPEARSVYEIYHRANWPVEDAPEKYRYKDALVLGDGYGLVNGLELYRLDENGEVDWKRPLNLADHAQEHQKLLMAYGKWWSRVYPALRNPRSFEVGEQNHSEILSLTALDWRASKIILKNGESPSFRPPKSIGDLKSKLTALLKDEKYRESFPSYSGSWSINIKRAGRYQITARLLPKEEKDAAHYRLKKGMAHVRLGKRESQLRLMEGSSQITVQMDVDAGVQDLECWFTGQLALERVLGAFFVTIERVGEKKLDLKLNPKIQSLDQNK